MHIRYIKSPASRVLPAAALASAALAGTLTFAPGAQADTIDDMLTKLPAGPISCEQAQRYWTNEADYNNKVRQAHVVARFDARGPQIIDALTRVDEAATRCGLKGGGAPAQPPAPAPAPAPAQQPGPVAPGASPSSQALFGVQIPAHINLTPQGMPAFEVPVAGVTTVALPDVLAMLHQALAEILAYFNITLP